MIRSKSEFWVKYPKMLKNEVKSGNLLLYKDPSYKPEWNLILQGEIASLPSGFSKDGRHLEGILNIGDTIYFDYKCVAEDYIHDGLLKVPVEFVFCYIKDGIRMYNGYVLCVASLS